MVYCSDCVVAFYENELIKASDLERCIAYNLATLNIIRKHTGKKLATKKHIVERMIGEKVLFAYCPYCRKKLNIKEKLQ